MKVFLRNPETGQYYAGPKRWSGNSSLAQDFRTVESATDLAQAQKLAKVSVVLHYDEPPCELVLPVEQAR